MSILVFGSTGQVGKELATHEGVVCLGRDKADLTNPSVCIAAIQAHNPRAVINAAAYTAVDAAEENQALAAQINADAPRAMARACAALDIPFVHISTDYVLSGAGTDPATPDAATDPQNAYGRTKLTGEAAIQEIGGRYAILRTSWVFSAHGANFVKTMLRLAQTRDSLNVVSDQIGGPTSARAIADACLRIAHILTDDATKSGVYHFSGAPDVSWNGFATEIFKQADCAVQVGQIATKDYPTPAKRPLNSRLDCSLTAATFGISRPDWRADLAHVLKELETQNDNA